MTERRPGSVRLAHSREHAAGKQGAAAEHQGIHAGVETRAELGPVGSVPPGKSAGGQRRSVGLRDFPKLAAHVKTAAVAGQGMHPVVDATAHR